MKRRRLAHRDNSLTNIFEHGEGFLGLLETFRSEVRHPKQVPFNLFCRSAIFERLNKRYGILGNIEHLLSG